MTAKINEKTNNLNYLKVSNLKSIKKLLLYRKTLNSRWKKREAYASVHLKKIPILESVLCACAQCGAQNCLILGSCACAFPGFRFAAHGYDPQRLR